MQKDYTLLTLNREVVKGPSEDYSPLYEPWSKLLIVIWNPFKPLLGSILGVLTRAHIGPLIRFHVNFAQVEPEVPCKLELEVASLES